MKPPSNGEGEHLGVFNPINGLNRGKSIMRWIIKNRGKDAKQFPVVTLDNPSTHEEIIRFWQVLGACGVTLKS